MKTILSKSSLAQFIIALSKNENDPFWSQFVTVNKDAAAAIEAERFTRGFAELDVAEALGLSDVSDYINFVDSGKGFDVTPEGIKALAKLFKMSVEELAAKMVAADPSALSDAAAGADSPNSSNTAAPTDSPDTAKSNTKKTEERKTQKQSSLISFIRESTEVQKSDTLISEAIHLPLLKMQLAGLRKSLDLRKDSITPLDFTPGSWIPEQASGLIDLMVEGSEILSKVNVIKAPSKKYNAEIIDGDNIQLRRLPVGFATNDNNRQKVTNSRVTLDLKKVDIEFALTTETIQLHKHNIAGLENIIFDKFIKGMRNRFQWAGFNATADTADDVELVTDPTQVAIGWLKLADTLVPSGQKLVTGTQAPDVMYQSLIDAMLDGANDRFYDEEMLFLSSWKDWKKYLKDLGDRTDGLSAVIGTTADKKHYSGHGIETHRFLSTGNTLLARYVNLVFGILDTENEGILIERHPQPGGVIYRLTAWIDYALFNPNGIAVAKP
jgi:hypothetical protein